MAGPSPPPRPQPAPFGADVELDVSPDGPHHQEEDDARECGQHDPFRCDAHTQRDAQREQGDDRPDLGPALDVDQVEEVGEQDEENRKDVDHADARLQEEHAVEAGQRRSSYREQSKGPEPSREEVHHRDTERADDAAGDAPAEGVEAEVDVVALGPLEVFEVPAVAPLAGADHQLGQRRFGVEVVVPAVLGGRAARLDTLEVVVGVDREVDLVEDLAVGR